MRIVFLWNGLSTLKKANNTYESFNFCNIILYSLEVFLELALLMYLFHGFTPLTL